MNGLSQNLIIREQIQWKEDQLKTTLHSVCQEKETFKLYLPKGKEQEEIFNRVQSYSEIIQDESLLEQSWKQYISLKTGEYLNYWSPSSFVKNRFLRVVLNN
jgi:poly-gamma-glutamate synthesis protein (capsule biosynthesis protein)